MEDRPLSITDSLSELARIEQERHRSETHHPFWRSLFIALPILISVAAAAVAAYYSASSIRQSQSAAQDQRDATKRERRLTVQEDAAQANATARQQLETLVQSLAEKPKTDVASQVEAEQAAQLIKKLGDNVSTSAAYQVGASMEDNGEIANALYYFRLATQENLKGSGLVAVSQLTAAAWRGEANLNYVQGHLKQGQTDISHAYKVESHNTGFGPYEVAQNKVFTHLFDAGLQLRVRNCTSAKQAHDNLLAAEKLTPKADPVRQTTDIKTEAVYRYQLGDHSKPHLPAAQARLIRHTKRSPLICPPSTWRTASAGPITR